MIFQLGALALLAEALAQPEDLYTMVLSDPVREDREVKMSWDVFEVDDAKMLRFDVAVTDGEDLTWFGLGVSSSGTMKGMEAQILTIEDNEVFQGELQTVRSFDFVQPSPIFTDEPAKLESVSLKDGTLYITYTRPMASCVDFALDLRDGTQKYMLYAYGTSDWGFSYHGPRQRGGRQIMFENPRPQQTLPDYDNMPEVSSMYMPFGETEKGHQVTEHRTEYVCMIFSPPERDSHMIAYEINIATKYVHHMILYSCNDDIDPHFQDGRRVHEEGDVFGCGAEENMGNCLATKVGWAVGGSTTVVLDADQGTPLKANQYFKMELHYDNPEGDRDQFDDTSVMIYYTEPTRPVEMGAAIFGPIPNWMIIPPNERAYEHRTVIGPSCTRFLPQAIKLHSIAPHGHQTMTYFSVKIIRQGDTVHHFQSFYDFNAQGGHEIDGFWTLEPNDTMEMICTYDTSDRRTTLFGGEGSDEEMCIAGFSYSPAIENWNGQIFMFTDPVGRGMKFDRFPGLEGLTAYQEMGIQVTRCNMEDRSMADSEDWDESVAPGAYGIEYSSRYESWPENWVDQYTGWNNSEIYSRGLAADLAYADAPWSMGECQADGTLPTNLDLTVESCDVHFNTCTDRDLEGCFKVSEEAVCAKQCQKDESCKFYQYDSETSTCCTSSKTLKGTHYCPGKKTVAFKEEDAFDYEKAYKALKRCPTFNKKKCRAKGQELGCTWTNKKCKANY